MRKHCIWAIGLLLVVVLLISPSVFGKHWIYLGNAHVDGNTDHDTIRTTDTQAFHTIQLRVHGGAVELQRVVVHYGDGTQDEVAVGQRVGSGDKTREIDLPGDHRTISSVEIWYGKDKWDQRPEVRLYAAP